MSNPTLNENTMKNLATYNDEMSLRTMTVSGLIGKLVILFSLMLCTAVFTFEYAMQGLSDKAFMFMNVGLIGGLISAIFVCLKPNSKYMVLGTIVYAMFEGLAIGGVTGAFAASAGGELVINAVLATFASLFSTLFLYKTGIIKCTESFKSTIVAATLGVFIIYLFCFITSFFTPAISNVVFGGGTFALGLNALICAIAVFNFILDFDTIENGVRMNLPDKFEWYCGFSLLVTLVWVYIEFLRLFGRKR